MMRLRETTRFARIVCLAFAALLVARGGARADETRAIVEAATVYDAANVFTRIAWTHASVVRAGDYALFSAENGEAGAGAFLERKNARWEIEVLAKGMFAADLLTSLGVPPDKADRLVMPCPPRTLFFGALPTPLAINGIGPAYTITAASHRVIQLKVRTVRVAAESVVFKTLGPKVVSKIVPASTIFVCEP